jgi:alkaline phosphatase D
VDTRRNGDIDGDSFGVDGLGGILFHSTRREFLRLLWKLPLAGLLPLRAMAENFTSKPRKSFQLAFGSCAFQDDDQPIWDAITADKPDVFAFIGDNIYGDSEDMKEIAAKYVQLGKIPAFQRFRRKIPLVFTWDDHDLGANDSGCEYPFKAETKSLMFQFFGENMASVRARREGVYTSYMYGSPGERTQVILMDLRWFRTALISDENGYVPNPDPAATMLGEAQWRWLEEELSKPADFRILASSTQFASSDHVWEKWANFPLEKARLLALIDGLQIRNLAVISGDIHFGELSLETTPEGFDVYDLTSSGLNLFESAAEIPNSKRLEVFDAGCNYGHVTVDYGNERNILVTLEVRDLHGRTMIQRRLSYPRESLIF